MLPFETRHRRREIRMKISFWMREGIVAMKIMEMAFQHNFGWRREGNLINHDPFLNNKKKEFHHQPLATAHIRIQWIL